MNTPRLTAERSLYKARGHYLTGGRMPILRNTIRPALQNVGNGLTCSGNCPKDSPILCQGDNGGNCICCPRGCEQTPAGVAVCSSNSKTGIVGRSGTLQGSPGGVLNR